MNITEADVLRKIGIKVPRHQITQTYNMLLADPQYSKQVQKIRSSLGTMINQDQFIQCIIASHKNIVQIPDNSKVIQSRDNTFSIRAINPQNIKSLTERAFFNSFNLDRNVLNDLQQQIKLHKNTSYRAKETKQRNCNDTNQSRGRTENNQQQKCICNRNIPDSQWIQCCNQEKCRGSNWYHLECSGLEGKDLQTAKDPNFNFTCEMCKREDVDGESPSNQIRKRNQQADYSGRV